MPGQFENPREQSFAKLPISTNEAEEMVRLYTERQTSTPGAVPGLTLDAVIELLQISPDEAKRLLDEVRNPMPPVVLSVPAKQVTPRKFPKAAFIAVAIIVTAVWVVAIASAMGRFTHDRYVNRRAFLLHPAARVPKGFDLAIDANTVASEMVGGPKKGQDLTKLTAKEADAIRAQLELAAIDSLAELSPSFYALPVHPSGADRRTLTVKVRPFGASWTRLLVPVEQYMIENIGEGGFGREALQELLDRQLKARWKDIVKSASADSAVEPAVKALLD